jgi:CheY-like chemotaxis protein
LSTIRADTRELVSATLEHGGFDVITASNGAEAFLAAHDARPSVIVMDVNMPVLDGIETTRLLKSVPHTRTIRVIAHTATHDFALGTFDRLFAGLLRKPVGRDVVLASVARLLPALGAAD